MKRCKKCGEEKPLTEFHSDRAVCKGCTKARDSAYRAANPEKMLAWRIANREKARAYSKAYCAANWEKVRADRKAYRAANREKVREAAVCRKKGAPPGTKKRLYQEQRGLCAWCGQPLPEMLRSYLEHDHDSRLVRGVVHASCNNAIWAIDAFPDIAERYRLYVLRAELRA